MIRLIYVVSILLILILQTLKDLGTTQKQMREKFSYMSKGFISNVFKESIIAEWFYKEQSLVSQNLFIYYASPMMVNGAYNYYNTIESSRIELLFTKWTGVYEMNGGSY